MDTFLTTAGADVMVGLPAAVVRVALEWQVKPGMRWLFTIGDKVRALVISLGLAIMVGEVARAWPAPIEKLSVPPAVLVMATAFLGQDLAMRLLPAVNAWLNAKFPLKKPGPGEEEAEPTERKDDDEK